MLWDSLEAMTPNKQDCRILLEWGGRLLEASELELSLYPTAESSVHRYVMFACSRQTKALKEKGSEIRPAARGGFSATRPKGCSRTMYRESKQTVAAICRLLSAISRRVYRAAHRARFAQGPPRVDTGRVG